MGDIINTTMDNSPLSAQFSVFHCPICQSPWDSIETASARSLVCLKNHNFDLAKSGYANLLPANHKNSKEPGDDQTAVQSRLTFLAHGHYDKLIATLSSVIDNIFHETTKPATALDIGCGPGYYVKKLAAQTRTPLNLYGLDISKFAVNAAAKQCKDARFCVASSNNLPVHSHAVDLALTIFAPPNESEVHRVLKPGGHWIKVTPGASHLKQLRAILYKDLSPIEKTQPISTFFELATEGSEAISYSRELDQIQLMHLLNMTPYRWTQQSAVTEKSITLPEQLTVDFSFQIQLLSRPLYV